MVISYKYPCLAITLKVTKLMLYWIDSSFYSALAETRYGLNIFNLVVWKSPRGILWEGIWSSVLERKLLMSLFDKDFTSELRSYFKNIFYKVMNMKQCYWLTSGFGLGLQWPRYMAGIAGFPLPGPLSKLLMFGLKLKCFFFHLPLRLLTSLQSHYQYLDIVEWVCYGLNIIVPPQIDLLKSQPLKWWC